MTRTYHYILSILVMFFGWWLLSGPVVYRPQGVTLVQAIMLPTSIAVESQYSQSNHQYQHANEQYVVARAQVNSVLTGSGQLVNADQAEVNQPPSEIDDAAWFTGVMSAAREIKDRVINISMDGNSQQRGSADVPASVVDSGGAETGEENLPQPSDNQEYVDNNKVDCPSMMYMGGNAYGRNMLIRMGCQVP